MTVAFHFDVTEEVSEYSFKIIQHVFSTFLLHTREMMSSVLHGDLHSRNLVSEGPTTLEDEFSFARSFDSSIILKRAVYVILFKNIELTAALSIHDNLSLENKGFLGALCVHGSAKKKLYSNLIERFFVAGETCYVLSEDEDSFDPFLNKVLSKAGFARVEDAFFPPGLSADDILGLLSP